MESATSTDRSRQPSLLYRPVAALLPEFCVAQMLGISGAVVAAVIEIESIVGAGPALSVLGLALAGLGWKKGRSRSAVFFGLSVGAVTVAVFLLIYLQGWSPTDAQYPVPLILMGYEYLIAPIALLAAYRLRQEGNTGVFGTGSVQFGLRQLLLVTTFLAVVFAALRLAMSGHPLPAALAPGPAVIVAAFFSLRGTRRQDSRSASV